MLLSVGEDFPQPREELDPGLLGQRCRNVAQLDKGTEQRPRLWAEEDGSGESCAFCIPVKGTLRLQPSQPPELGDRPTVLLSSINGR